ncbi:amidohydrolase [Leptolyngbya sp. 'hensonii']|uniref:amidohydrolase family protein n=1 Tax=Leptolyngbya sp. 'hensonii' TaxID=1922337 RepID=UPI00094FF671|nr:amidohydrolase [Leptolyngbya sp. 'hensonii']OLP19674.1 amidohydrolase [Leptolyngbya sp. 'hensonii']
MNFLIQNALVLHGEGYAAVDVEIRAGWIQAIRPAHSQNQDAGLPTVDGQDKLLLPGFVNGHTHSTQIWQRGLIPQLPLELWLADLVDTTPIDLEAIYLGALTTAVQTLLSGGTCLMDHLYLVLGQELETIAAVVRAYQEVGIRAVIAPLLQDEPWAASIPQGWQRLPHQPMPRSTSETLAILEEIVTTFHDPEGTIRIGVGPTGFHRCSDDLLRGCAELSDRYDLCRHMHLLETRVQKRLAQEKYGGSAVRHLQHLGFLDYRASLAHCVWLDPEDLAILAETRATVVHNPLSNLRLGSGIAPILKCLQSGVNVALGCDGAASNDGQDLLETLKLSTILHNVTEIDYRQWITPRRVVEMATLGGARGVNLADRIGSLAVGKQADLVLYDLKHLSLLPRTDPVGLLVLGRPTAVVNAVWIGGQQVVAEGRIITIEVEELTQTLHDRSCRAAKPQFQTIDQIETYYRQIMSD